MLGNLHVMWSHILGDISPCGPWIDRHDRYLQALVSWWYLDPLRHHLQEPSNWWSNAKSKEFPRFSLRLVPKKESHPATPWLGYAEDGFAIHVPLGYSTIQGILWIFWRLGLCHSPKLGYVWSLIGPENLPKNYAYSHTIAPFTCCNYVHMSTVGSK